MFQSFSTILNQVGGLKPPQEIQCAQPDAGLNSFCQYPIRILMYYKTGRSIHFQINEGLLLRQKTPKNKNTRWCRHLLAKNSYEFLFIARIIYIDYKNSQWFCHKSIISDYDKILLICFGHRKSPEGLIPSGLAIKNAAFPRSRWAIYPKGLCKQHLVLSIFFHAFTSIIYHMLKVDSTGFYSILLEFTTLFFYPVDFFQCPAMDFKD